MRALLLDLAAAGRTLLRAPRFTLPAGALLALGLAAAALVWALLEHLVLRPLPYPAAAELVGLRALHPPKSLVQERHSVADFRSYAERAPSFAALAAYRPNFAALTRPPQPAVRLVTALVTEQFFATFGVVPALGGTLPDDAFSESGARRVILSDGFWRRELAAAPDVIGQVITLDDQPHTITGVMPPTFREPDFVDAWLPFPREAPEHFARDSRFWSIVGRLRAGATLAQAGSELATVARDLAQEFPASNRDWQVAVTPLHELRTAALRPTLWLLSGAVLLVLLVACGNLASLQLARSLARRPQFALQLALGATPAQLARRVLAESLLLALGGAVAGLLLATVLGPTLLRVLPADALPPAAGFTLSGPVVALAGALALGLGVLAGGWPAWQVLRTNLAPWVQQAGVAAVAGRGARRWQTALLAGQVALTFVVLSSALLLLRSARALSAVPPGFDARGLVALRLAPPMARLETNDDLARYYENLVAVVAAVPGVTGAAVNASAPFSGVTLDYPVWRQGTEQSPTGAGDAVYAPVTPDYFATLVIPLQRGRLLSAHDRAGAAPVVVVNEAFARRFFPGGDALGQRVQILPWMGDVWREIVGVVADTRQSSLAPPPPPQVYVPQAQLPWFFSTLLVRVAQPGVWPALQAALQQADPTLPFALLPMEEKIAATAARPRLLAALFGGFAAATLGLALFGLYAGLRWHVTQHRRELGVRLALGATRGQLARGLLLTAGRAVGAGLALGVLGQLAASEALTALLYGVQPRDPGAIAAVAALLPLAALLAVAPSVWRATQLDPALTLRAT